MDYTSIRSNRKTIAIIIRDGEVIVRAPYAVTEATIADFVRSKKNWIQKKLRQYQPLGLDLTQDSLILFGRKYFLKLETGVALNLEIDDTHIYIMRPHNVSLEKVTLQLEHTFKKQLQDYIAQQLPYVCEALGVKLPPYKLRKYRRLYGRCNQRGELAFNTYLYHEDPRFIDYVIVHECAHLLEFNHSSRFYDLVKKVMPDYKEIMNLRMQGPLTHQDQ